MKRLNRVLCVCLMTLFGANGVLAQSDSASPSDHQAFWTSLKQGGKVVLLRHATVDKEFGNPFVLDDSCFTERNLNDHGQQQAEAIGQAFQRHGIQVGQVMASPHCRTKETAERAFGAFVVEPILRLTKALPAEQARQNIQRTQTLIGNYQGQKTLVLVTHRPNIADLIFHNLQPGEMVALDPLGDGLFDVLSIYRQGEE